MAAAAAGVGQRTTPPHLLIGLPTLFIYTDEVNAVVLDIGTYAVKAGYAGEDTPKYVFPSVRQPARLTPLLPPQAIVLHGGVPACMDVLLRFQPSPQYQFCRLLVSLPPALVQASCAWQQTAEVLPCHTGAGGRSSGRCWARRNGH